MGQTLYVEVQRDAPLSDVERSAIEVIVGEFDVGDEIERFGADPEALNWESFLYAGDPGVGVVLWGSTRLPDVTMSAIFKGIDHWGRMLGKIRTEVFPDAAWDVRVEGDPVEWIAAEQRFGIPDLPDVDWDAVD